MRREPEHVHTSVTSKHVKRTAKTAFGAALLRREASVLLEAAGRAGAPHLLSSCLESEPYTITLEKIAGVSLQQTVIDRRLTGHPLPATLALQWVMQTTMAVDSWHSESGMVHGDIAPGNVLLQHRQAFLIDFALATPFGQPVGLAGMTLANRAYASPEQLAGEPIGPHSDVFSLAVLATELLTGKRFDRQDPVSGHTSLPGNVVKVLLVGVSADPGQRPSSARDFAQALEVAACR